MCPSMAAGAVSLKKPHDIVISSFCNIVKGQAIYDKNVIQRYNYIVRISISFMKFLMIW